MMLINGEDVTSEFAITVKDKIDPNRFSGYIPAALAKLKSWLPETAWADANSETPTDADRKLIVKSAAVYLVMYFALPNLHTYLTERGVLLSSQNEGNTTNKYLTPKEVRENQANYWATAQEMVSSILAVDDSPGDGAGSSTAYPESYSSSVPIEFVW